MGSRSPPSSTGWRRRSSTWCGSAPIRSSPGDRLPHGLMVKKRLGKGASSLALLVDRAGEKTLAQRLREEGRLHLELLERFGEDLLQVVDWLEQQGVPHRDIKPDNLGVALTVRAEQLHLVLFDFSLAQTPAENIRAGTEPYLDPFLALRKPPRWDTDAERGSRPPSPYTRWLRGACLAGATGRATRPCSRSRRPSIARAPGRRPPRGTIPGRGPEPRRVVDPTDEGVRRGEADRLAHRASRANPGPWQQS